MISSNRGKPNNWACKHTQYHERKQVNMLQLGWSIILTQPQHMTCLKDKKQIGGQNLVRQLPHLPQCSNGPDGLVCKLLWEWAIYN